MKRNAMFGVLLVSMCCSGCGGSAATYFGLAVAYNVRQNIKMRDQNKGVDVSWMEDTSKVPIDPVKPEDYEPVKVVKPTQEQLDRLQKLQKEVSEKYNH